jgi:biotin carboxyl carrier protein
MKLKAGFAGQEHELKIQHVGDRLAAEIDGRRYELTVRDLARGEYLLAAADRIYDCRVGVVNEQSHIFEVHLRGSVFGITITDPKRLRSASDSGGHHHGAAEISAPMPGKVVRVLVEAGQEIEAGAGIVVVEAMKMQNEMKAPKAGKVVSLRASPGATVNAGDVLAVIE